MRVSAAATHEYLYTRVATYSGMGGPEKADYSDPQHPSTPTRAGRFVITSIGPHTTMQVGTGARVWSAVAWGTPLRLDPKGVVQIKLPGKDWQRLTSLPAWRHLDHDQARVASDIEDRNLLLWTPVLGAFAKNPKETPIGFYRKIPDKWVFNDFGHVAVKYYRDVNHNGHQDATEAERTLSDFIHTTPNHELFELLNQKANAGISSPLTASHGCVHALPSEVDELIQGGYLRVGGTFVVHSYTERIVGVFSEKTTEMRTDSREVHFFPRENKLIVYMVTRLS